MQSHRLREVAESMMTSASLVITLSIIAGA
jgi:hypothetical protein